MCSNRTYESPTRPGKTIFSLSELKKLLEQENACVSCVTCQRSIDITPMHLANLKTSIRDLLDEKVNNYDVELQGVVLAHKNVKIFAGSVVFNDSRYFPLEYVADIYVFKPEIGSKLTGVVNKMPLNREYVSVLVHNIFNVVVYAAHKQPKPAVKMGSSINVTVTYIDFTGRLPFIKAEISPEDLNSLEEAGGMDEEMSPPQPLQIRVRKELTSILRNSPSRVQQSSTDIETESSCAENGAATQLADSSRMGETDIKQKKKKKRDKERKDRESGKLVLTPSKKRKHTHDEDGESSSPSKKKKRKHGEWNTEDEILMKENGAISLNDTPINPLESTAQIMADLSICKAASSTPILELPSPSKKKKPKTRKIELPEPSKLQQAVAKVKSDLRTADSGISSSDENKSDKSVKVKVKRGSVSSERDTQDSSKGKSLGDLGSLKEEEVSKKKKKKKKEKKSETVDDINQRLLEEALKDL